MALSSFYFSLAFQAINLLIPPLRLCRIQVLSCPSPVRNQWKQLLLAAPVPHLHSALGLPGFSLHSPPAEALIPDPHFMAPAFQSGETNNMPTLPRSQQRSVLTSSVCQAPPTLTKLNVGGEAGASEYFKSPTGDPEAREVEALA